MPLKKLIIYAFAVAGLSLPLLHYNLTGTWTPAKTASPFAQKADLAKRCADARQQRDALYKQGAHHPDEEARVRAACERDELAQQAAQPWLFAAVALAFCFFMLPLVLRSRLPSTMR